MLPVVCVELGRVTAEDMVSVRSDGDGAIEGAIVEAMDMVRICGMLPWLAFLVFVPGPMFGGGEIAGDRWPSEAISGVPDSCLRPGITLPLIMVCCGPNSLSPRYEVIDIVRSSGRSGTTRPWAVVLAMWFMYGCWRKAFAGDW